MEFAARIERMMRLSLGVDLSAEVCWYSIVGLITKPAHRWTHSMRVMRV